jgi:hypothetical protein
LESSALATSLLAKLKVVKAKSEDAINNVSSDGDIERSISVASLTENTRWHS